jgi:hypothetical protein
VQSLVWAKREDCMLLALRNFGAVHSLWKMRWTGRMAIQGSSKQRDCPNCLDTPVPAQVSDVPVRHGFAE